MINRLANILAAAISGLLTGVITSHSDEIINSFSLGHGSLTLTDNDPKTPTPSLLTAKYGFTGAKGFKPYLGTGLAYTLHVENRPGEKAKITAGIAGQAGFNYILGGSSSLNIDYKYFHLSPDSKHGDTPPQSIGVGFKIQF